MRRLSSLLLTLFFSVTISFAQNGLIAEYYNGINFEDYVGNSQESNLDVYWDMYPPIEGIHPDYCSVRYTGSIITPRTGTIKFSARVDDGIRMYIDGNLVMENWQLNDVGYSNADVYLEEGQKYDLKIEYYNAMNEAELRLLWELPPDPEDNWVMQWWNSDDPQIIPAEYFRLPVEKIIIEEPGLEPIPEPDPTPEPTPAIELKPEPDPTPPPVVEVTRPVTTTTVITEEVIKQYIPKSVEFEQAKSEILPVSFPDLDKLATFLVENPDRHVKIEGHTDNIGDPVKNQELSERRSRAVAAYLIKQDVDHTQITHALGFGGSQPIAKADGRKYHPENRRVEFIIE